MPTYCRRHSVNCCLRRPYQTKRDVCGACSFKGSKILGRLGVTRRGRQKYVFHCTPVQYYTRCTIVKAFDNCCVIKLHYFLCGSSTEGSADPRLLIISRRGRIRVLRLPPPAAAALDRLLHLRAGLTPGVQRPSSSRSCPFPALRPCRQHHVLWFSAESPTSCS